MSDELPSAVPVADAGTDLGALALGEKQAPGADKENPNDRAQGVLREIMSGSVVLTILAVVVALALAVAPVPALTVALVLALALAVVDRAPGSATLAAVLPPPATVAIAPITSSRPKAAIAAVSRWCPRSHDGGRRGAWDG